jgi:hypothetical protein
LRKWGRTTKNSYCTWPRKSQDASPELDQLGQRWFDKEISAVKPSKWMF